MSVQDEYLKYKEEYKKSILLIKRDDFYYCLDNDAIIIHYYLRYNYRIDSYKSLCFSVKALAKVKKRLDIMNITYLIIDNKLRELKAGSEEEYDKCLEVSQEYEKREKIISNIEEKIKYSSLEELKKILILVKEVQEK